MTQSNEPTIDQMNETIALFMGYKKREKLYPTDRQILEGEDLPNWYEDSLKYHTSWDWLMPVVEKIRDMVRKEKDLGERRLLPRWVPIQNELCNVNITNVHYCVYKFITWLNQQKQKDGE